MALPRPITQLISAAPMAMPTFVAGAAATSDAAQLALHPALACLLVGTGVLTSVHGFLSGGKHDRDTKRSEELMRALCKQQGDWKRGFEDLLIAKGIDLTMLPEAARLNPLAQFYLLMTASQQEVAHFLKRNSGTHLSLLRAIDQNADEIIDRVTEGHDLIREAQSELAAIQHTLDDLLNAVANIEAKYDTDSKNTLAAIRRALPDSSPIGVAGPTETEPTDPGTIFAWSGRPALPGYFVDRARERAAFEAAVTRDVVPIVVVCAIGGQGKTTLVADWLTRHDRSRTSHFEQVCYFSAYRFGVDYIGFLDRLTKRIP